MSAFTVRQATPEDFAAASAMLPCTKRGNTAAAYVLGSGQYVRHEQRSTWLRAWVALDERGECVGVACGTEQIDALWIQDLYVTPGERRKGIGSALLLQAMSHADNEQIPTEVVCRYQDRDGLEFLRHWGFERKTETDVNGDPAIVLSKDVSMRIVP